MSLRARFGADFDGHVDEAAGFSPPRLRGVRSSSSPHTRSSTARATFWPCEQDPAHHYDVRLGPEGTTMDVNVNMGVDGVRESQPWDRVVTDAAPSEHIVQLYQDQDFLNRAVCR